ncbi:hypothetical protein Rxycam_00876 [Rubrobacter xylanophilus DSM 9941]|uniref:hypothetical protein n=1 Tax=Rubrobacter xylanophilus TaxID=49319 RepID=UPI001C64420C|nr:hypothetical protein [Rubrobacter xylanophilus]QYJ15064.1 hypothetical protein Rxycam_00876 [Rubrobacter xylanophilus DSM 9941]
MVDEPRAFVQRVLVVLDASPQNPAVLESATELAARLRSELLAMFVEDANLLRLAELPFLRAVDPFSGVARELNGMTMERGMRVYARRAQETLRQVAAGRRVRWSFRTVQGTGISSAVSAASGTDLIVLSSPAGLADEGVRELLAERGGAVLVLSGRLRPGGTVVVVWSGDPESDRALEAAAYLAGSWRAPLVLLVPSELSGGSAPEVPRLPGAASRTLRRFDEPCLSGVLREVGGTGLLVLPFSAGIKLRSLLEEARWPVLLVA